MFYTEQQELKNITLPNYYSWFKDPRHLCRRKCMFNSYLTTAHLFLFLLLLFLALLALVARFLRLVRALLVPLEVDLLADVGRAVEVGGGGARGGERLHHRLGVAWLRATRALRTWLFAAVAAAEATYI